MQRWRADLFNGRWSVYSEDHVYNLSTIHSQQKWRPDLETVQITIKHKLRMSMSNGLPYTNILHDVIYSIVIMIKKLYGNL